MTYTPRTKGFTIAKSTNTKIPLLSGIGGVDYDVQWVATKVSDSQVLTYQVLSLYKKEDDTERYLLTVALGSDETHEWYPKLIIASGDILYSYIDNTPASNNDAYVHLTYVEVS